MTDWWQCGACYVRVAQSSLQSVITSPPFGGPVYHNSALITPTTVITQVIRQEHQTGNGLVSPTKSFVEAVSNSPGKSNTNDSDKNVIGRQEDPPGTGVNNNYYHHGGRVWIIWLPQVFHVKITHTSDQLITAHIDEITSGDSFLFTVVYGHNDDADRKSLWDQLKAIHDTYNGPWGVCGDFNSVLHFNQRIGREVQWAEIEDFRDCNLEDLRGQGAFFTWNNKQDPSSRHFFRLDRFLVNPAWLDKYPDSLAAFLLESFFDHNPCVCYRRVKQSISGTLIFQFVTRLKSLKKPLREVNRNRFSDVEIEITFLDYYKSLLGTSKQTLPVHLPTVRTRKLVTDIYKTILLSTVTHAEIKQVVFSIPSTKSSGPDGFSSQFYKDAWDIIGGDVIKAVQDLFCTGKILKQVNTTKLTLIPKVQNPTSVSEFRPIACCNIIYKVIAKVLCNRLSEVYQIL
ncbi:uncharacterized protein LOC141613546 [Silene latifolia]|uniref:uncharacterized protein LOC141613546 n=1 Tax=Silene latifolia TaxID=37657 RepID=UPI003D789F9C